MAQQGPDSSQNGGAQGPHSGQLLLPRPRSAPGGEGAGPLTKCCCCLPCMPACCRCGTALYCSASLTRDSCPAGLDSLPEQPAHGTPKQRQGDQDDDRGAGGGGGIGGSGGSSTGGTGASGDTGASAGGSTGRGCGSAGSVEQQDAEQNDRAAHHRRLFEASRHPFSLITMCVCRGPAEQLHRRLPSAFSSSPHPWNTTVPGVWQEAQARLGHTAGGSAHAGMEFYRPIEGYPGATTSLGRHTANGGATPAQQVARAACCLCWNLQRLAVCLCCPVPCPCHTTCQRTGL
jgi:hypothetical protein